MRIDQKYRNKKTKTLKQHELQLWPRLQLREGYDGSETKKAKLRDTKKLASTALICSQSSWLALLSLRYFPIFSALQFLDPSFPFFPFLLLHIYSARSVPFCAIVTAASADIAIEIVTVSHLVLCYVYHQQPYNCNAFV